MKIRKRTFASLTALLIIGIILGGCANRDTSQRNREYGRWALEKGLTGMAKQFFAANVAAVESSQDRSDQNILGWAYLDLASAYVATDEFGTANDLYEKALACFERDVEPNPDVDTAMTYDAIAVMWHRAGRTVEEQEAQLKAERTWDAVAARLAADTVAPVRPN